MKIGIVDLDTSHPASWIPIERAMGHEVVGVWDSGVVHPAGYAEKFAADRAIPRVFSSLVEMAAEVDCAVIHGCDWGTHIEKARPFLAKGKAVMVDKPLAGNVRDLRQLAQWADQGKRITGGSALRYCVEVRHWLAMDPEQRGRPHTVFCGCAVDEFNYGIHAYSLLSGIMGPGIISARHLGAGVQRRVQVNWADGRMGLIAVGKQAASLPFHASIVTERGQHQLVADPNLLYRALLEATLPYLSGQAETPPVPVRDLIEPELAALAARQSWLNGNKEVRLAEVSEDDSGYDGAEFAAEYKRNKYGPR